MQTLMTGDESRTRPVRAEKLMPGDVVNLKGGPAVVYGWGEAPLSGRIILGFRNRWSEPEGRMTDREVVVPADLVYPVFMGKAEGF